MNDTNFIIKNFDPEKLAGQAQTTIDSSSTASSELEAIQKACQSQSQKMPKGYKVDYDGRVFKTERRQTDSGEKVIDVNFGIELKTEEL